jgi:mono/diheme cytochrome c family protein
MKHRLRTSVPLIVGLLAPLSVIAAAQAQTEDPVRHGRALVGEFCARCHAVARFGKSPDRNAVPFRTLGRNFDLDQLPRLLERGISSTHPDMPDFKFSEDDAHDATAYVRSIQR